MHSHDDKYPSRPGFEPGTPGYKPQSIQMSQRGRPSDQEDLKIVNHKFNKSIKFSRGWKLYQIDSLAATGLMYLHSNSHRWRMNLIRWILAGFYLRRDGSMKSLTSVASTSTCRYFSWPSLEYLWPRVTHGGQIYTLRAHVWFISWCRKLSGSHRQLPPP